MKNKLNSNYIDKSYQTWFPTTYVREDNENTDYLKQKNNTHAYINKDPHCIIASKPTPYNSWLIVGSYVDENGPFNIVWLVLTLSINLPLNPNLHWKQFLN